MVYMVERWNVQDIEHTDNGWNGLEYRPVKKSTLTSLQ